MPTLSQHTTSAISVLLIAWLLAHNAQASSVGTAAAVQPVTEGTPPGLQTRTIFVGGDILFEERIVTSKNGRVQIVFKDESTLTIGPDAEVTIDRFVYDPAASSGDVAISLGKGLLRFVGGRISKQNDVKIDTPSARIGVRGGIVLVRHDEQTEQTDCTFLFGQRAIVENDAGSVTLIRPGWTASAASPQRAPQETGRSPQVNIAQALKELEGRSGDTPVSAPRDDVVADDDSQLPSGTLGTSDAVQRGFIEALQSNRSTGDTPPAASPPVASPPPPPIALSGTLLLTASEGYTGDFGLVVRDPAKENFVGGPGQGKGAVDVTFAGERTIVDTGDELITLPLGVGDFRVDDFDTDSRLGRVTGTAFRDRGADIDDVGDDAVAYDLVASGLGGGRVILAAGSPPSDSTGVAAGFRIDSYTVRPDGGFRAEVPFLSNRISSSFDNPSVSPLRVARQPHGVPGERATGSAGQPLQSGGVLAAIAIEGDGAEQRSLLFLTQGAFTSVTGDDNEPQLAFRSRGIGSMRSNSGDSAVHLFADIGTTNDRSFLGTDLESIVLTNNGFFDGDPQLDFSAGGARALDGTTIDQFGFVHVAQRTADATPSTSSRSARTLTGYAAGAAESSLGTRVASPYVLVSATATTRTNFSITTDPQSNTLFAQMRVHDPLQLSDISEAQFNFGGIGTERGAGFIDDHTFGARSSNATPSSVNGRSGLASNAEPTGFSSALVSVGVVDTNALAFGNTGLCKCEYLKWGFWASDFSLVDADGAPRIDRVHLATWVAGELPGLLEIPTTGIARYQGHAIGSVIARAPSGSSAQWNQYIATGAFENAWNFATRSGNVTITGFDQHNFGGPVAAANGRDYSGILPSSTGNLDAIVHGSFFSSATNPVAETGGQFTIQDFATGGNNYRAAGTFAGKQAP